MPLSLCLSLFFSLCALGVRALWGLVVDSYYSASLSSGSAVRMNLQLVVPFEARAHALMGRLGCDSITVGLFGGAYTSVR